ncbi:transcription initiation factor TFIID subunit [Thalictrum thalictroides]|uniref:Transcription initiation factor TFIID subunit n=1 Tax=Thalictrum thalictroides TaxID=46969 RepID=A0A7J6VDK7_THATH|nr:transcription initiation factor TFIID subunit [Thalictrum thalictroides]
MRSQATPTNQPLANQKFQGHNLLRGPSMGTPSSPSAGTPQVMQAPHTQPWMAAPNQGKQMHPPLPSSQYRPQVKQPTLQQRSHNPQQQHHHPMATVSHQQMPSSQQSQQQPVSQMHQSQEHYGQQYPGTRIPHQQQTQRVIGSGNQKIPTTTAQTGPIQSGTPNIACNVDAGESSSHILTKRSIHELVSQIDPSEKLDPEVEDILMEIAEDFVDSITTVGCSLAKHRKSTTLEAKDILLHLERNWHMTLPGFGGDEIKGYKKQLTSDIHKERLAAVKKSMVVPDAVVTKSSGGQAAGNVKGHPAKAPATGEVS